MQNVRAAFPAKAQFEKLEAPLLTQTAPPKLLAPISL
jgi:hypothetical protein